MWNGLDQKQAGIGAVLRELLIQSIRRVITLVLKKASWMIWDNMGGWV